MLYDEKCETFWISTISSRTSFKTHIHGKRGEGHVNLKITIFLKTTIIRTFMIHPIGLVGVLIFQKRNIDG